MLKRSWKQCGKIVLASLGIAAIPLSSHAGVLDRLLRREPPRPVVKPSCPSFGYNATRWRPFPNPCSECIDGSLPHVIDGGTYMSPPHPINSYDSLPPITTPQTPYPANPTPLEIGPTPFPSNLPLDSARPAVSPPYGSGHSLPNSALPQVDDYPATKTPLPNSGVPEPGTPNTLRRPEVPVPSPNRTGPIPALPTEDSGVPAVPPVPPTQDATQTTYRYYR